MRKVIHLLQMIHNTTEFDHYKFKLASKFNPTGPPTCESFITLNEHDFNNRPSHVESGYNNLTEGERLALKQLQNDKSIIIKAADKGRSVIVQSLEQYLSEGYRQLEDKKFYQNLDHNPTESFSKEINEFLLEMLNQGEISPSVYDYLFNKECRTSVLFYLPKIHKQTSPCPGHPVVSSVDSCTERISQLIDHFLNHCATRVRSYVKDTTHFLSIIDQQDQLPDNSWLITLDIQSLYTNIDNATGLIAAREALDNFHLG